MSDSMVTGTMRVEVEVGRYLAARLALFAGRRGLSVPRVVEMLLELSHMEEDGTLRVGPFVVGSDCGAGPEWARTVFASSEAVGDDYAGVDGYGRDVRARVAPGPAGRDRYGRYGLRDRTTETPRQRLHDDGADLVELEPETVHSHATTVAPRGPGCTCGTAPCGGLAPVREDCPEHPWYGPQLFWHAARFCLATD
ncbi:hypothetical protein [Kitasatospora sp. NPDC058478]|uniref:hypothetical protein n=1 Tax=unclassified Kitasatospora TaxID=2633591 RepID=UPI003657CEC6